MGQQRNRWVGAADTCDVRAKSSNPIDKRMETSYNKYRIKNMVEVYAKAIRYNSVAGFLFCNGVVRWYIQI